MHDFAMVVLGMAIAANWHDWMFPGYVAPSLDWLRRQVCRSN
jgi:hypothetical protein